jgi:hypothetical protein
MQRTIVAFEQDEQGAWIVELDCGHRRHVRHEPPFQVRPWVLDAETRQERIGTPIDCGLCAAGGESACFAHLVCPECGAVLDGGAHRPGCRSAA